MIPSRNRVAFLEPVRAQQQQVVSVAAPSRLGRQLEEVIVSLSKVGAPFALIGGLALASHKVIRATQDIDLLTDSGKADEIDRELVAIGYQCLHRSPDAGNYLRGDERVDFIYASRPAARRLLTNATAIQTAFGEVRVVSIEGLIGLKLQGFVNNSRRTQDLEDIKALIAANRQALKMDEVRERGNSMVSIPTDNEHPFAADGGITQVPAVPSRDPFEALDDLMTVIETLCPIWPKRETFSSTDRFLI